MFTFLSYTQKRKGLDGKSGRVEKSGWKPHAFAVRVGYLSVHITRIPLCVNYLTHSIVMSTWDLHVSHESFILSLGGLLWIHKLTIKFHIALRKEVLAALKIQRNIRDPDTLQLTTCRTTTDILKKKIGLNYVVCLLWMSPVIRQKYRAQCRCPCLTGFAVLIFTNPRTWRTVIVHGGLFGDPASGTFTKITLSYHSFCGTSAF